MKAKAIIRLRFQSKQQVDSIFQALEPETRSSVSSRSKVTVIREGDDLKLIFEAKDTSALRAATNSYLHWIRLTRDTLKSVRRLENT